MDQPKTEFTPEEKALYEFMVFFSLDSDSMVRLLVEWYPQAAKELEKGLSRTRSMAALLRK